MVVVGRGAIVDVAAEQPPLLHPAGKGGVVIVPAEEILARRMAEIAWQMLHQQRPYEDRPLTHNTFPDRSDRALVEVTS